ncbi:MAG: hypothetical protein WKG00_09970 [Polyangiaceae bacterium]
MRWPLVMCLLLASAGGCDDDPCVFYDYRDPTVEPAQPCLDVSVRQDDSCYSPEEGQEDGPRPVFVFTVSNGCEETFVLSGEVGSRGGSAIDAPDIIIEPGGSDTFHAYGGEGDGFQTQDGDTAQVSFPATLGAVDLVISAAAFGARE